MKASATLGTDWEAGSVQLLWADTERVFCRLPREDPGSERYAFMPVVHGSEHPPPQTINRLAHEYELKDCLDAAWSLRPVDLVRERGQTILVVKYSGGEPLDHLCVQPMEIGLFLRLAVPLSAAIGRAHGRGLVHKDIKPANVIADCASGNVWLTGFGVASRLLRERLAPEAPHAIAGTLAYMAPEQTGRMNRSIDTRGDLYALGVTFYQVLTGERPFTATDPMELVHCHIARQPVPRIARIPRM